MASSRDCSAQVFYVDLISLECTTSDDIEETQLIDLKNADNRTAEVTIIDDDEPGVIACARGVPYGAFDSCPSDEVVGGFFFDFE